MLQHPVVMSSAITPTLTNPVSAFVFSFTTYTLVLSLTSHTSIIRPAAFPLMVLYVWLTVASPVEFNHPLYANLIGGSVCNLTLHYVDAILLSRWTFETKGPTSSRGGLKVLGSNSKASKLRKEAGSVGQRLRFGTMHIFSPRFCGTPWEVQNVPPFDRHDAWLVPTRVQFLWRNAVRCAICITLLDLSRWLGGDPKLNPVLFSPSQVSIFARLGDITAEELVFRFITSVMFWLITYILFQGIYSGSAFVTVASGLSEVGSWRPLFGSLADCWSLRQFWGSFWHQALRQSLTSPARFITYSVLGLRKGSLPARYLFILSTFLFSGLLHMCGDVAAGLSWHKSGSLLFFCNQTVGIMLEDGARAVYDSFVGREAEGEKRPRLWKRVLGYAWVLAWMTWSTPAWTYPVSEKSKGEGVLPFRIVERFVE